MSRATAYILTASRGISNPDSKPEQINYLKPDGFSQEAQVVHLVVQLVFQLEIRLVVTTLKVEISSPEIAAVFAYQTP